MQTGQHRPMSELDHKQRAEEVGISVTCINWPAFPPTLLWSRGFCFIPNEFNLLPFSLLEGKRLTVECHPALGTEVLLLQTLGMGIPPYTSYPPQDFTEIPCYWSQRGLRFETRLPVPAAFIVVCKCCLGLFVCLSFHQKLAGMHTL